MANTRFLCAVLLLIPQFRLNLGAEFCSEFTNEGFKGVTADASSCYKIIPAFLKFTLSLQKCKEYEKSGWKARMAYIPDEQVQSFIEELQGDTSASTSFIGLKKVDDKLGWTEDGTTSKTELKWTPDEMNEDDIVPYFQCMVVCRKNCPKGKKWQARHCNWPSTSVCEVYKEEAQNGGSPM